MILTQRFVYVRQINKLLEHNELYELQFNRDCLFVKELLLILMVKRIIKVNCL